MAPKFVSPYRMSGKRGKNDAAEAAAICEADHKECFICGITIDSVPSDEGAILTIDALELFTGDQSREQLR